MAKTFPVILRQRFDGGFIATCAGPVCMARGRTEESTLARIREEIGYRLELGPGFGAVEDHVPVELVRVEVVRVGRAATPALELQAALTVR